MKDIKIGDWVYIPAINEKGEVIGGYLDTTWNEKSYHVRVEDGRELDVLESNCELADYDPKTAFLTEMQALLEKYDVSIGTFEGCTVPTMPYGIMFGSKYQDRGDIYVFYDMPVISSDDIFNYDKE